jgi:hypothetical protein
MTVQQWTAAPTGSALAALVASCALIGLAACSSQGPATDAERLARGRELVKQMSARLAAAPAITVTTTEVRDVVRRSGAKKEVSLTAIYTMRRPDRFHSRMTGGGGLESWYNGKTLTIAAHPHKVFAQARMPETIDRTLDALAERYDMALPMGDLLYGSPEQALLSDTTKGGYAGTENVSDTRCVRLAFQDTGVDWELWLPVEGDPLPTRFKVVQKSRVGRPVINVTFTKWDLAPQTADDAFIPKVPADYEGIAVLQRAAAVKHATASVPAGSSATK